VNSGEALQADGINSLRSGNVLFALKGSYMDHHENEPYDLEVSLRPLAGLPVPEGQRCEWCCTRLTSGWAWSDPVLAALFSYYYCSLVCLEAHFFSK
jgi:hypothetical protein